MLSITIRCARAGTCRQDNLYPSISISIYLSPIGLVGLALPRASPSGEDEPRYPAPAHTLAPCALSHCCCRPPLGRGESTSGDDRRCRCCGSSSVASWPADFDRRMPKESTRPMNGPGVRTSFPSSRPPCSPAGEAASMRPPGVRSRAAAAARCAR
eukprot:scaffold10540_cov116-Isochrysis_galbana.AAC.10